MISITTLPTLWIFKDTLKSRWFWVPSTCTSVKNILIENSELLCHCCKNIKLGEKIWMANVKSDYSLWTMLKNQLVGWLPLGEMILSARLSDTPEGSPESLWALITRYDIKRPNPLLSKGPPPPTATTGKPYTVSAVMAANMDSVCGNSFLSKPLVFWILKGGKAFEAVVHSADNSAIQDQYVRCMIKLDTVNFHQYLRD
jgi:hypothetical protein